MIRPNTGSSIRATLRRAPAGTTTWQDVFLRTSTEQAPWYLVPADNRWYSRAVVSELLRNTLKNMNMIWPPLEVDADEMRRQLDTL